MLRCATQTGELIMKKPEMKRQPEINPKLNTSDPEVKNYVLELEKENLRLQKQIAKLQVKDISQQNQIIALKKAQPKTIIKVIRYDKNKK